MACPYSRMHAILLKMCQVLTFLYRRLFNYSTLKPSRLWLSVPMKGSLQSCACMGRRLSLMGHAVLYTKAYLPGPDTRASSASSLRAIVWIKWALSSRTL